MKLSTLLISVLAVAACGGADDPPAAATADAGDAEVTFCSCTNEPIRTSAKANACAELMEPISPAEAAGKAIACREQLPVPDGGPDLCFCLRTMTRDPALQEACSAILPADVTPQRMTEMIVDCSR
ncbi:MAG: hypothetical protein AAFX58_01425 [Pseudomonadota bacterium]